MGTATMTASSARWCAREGNGVGNGVQVKRGEVQGRGEVRGALGCLQRRAGKQEVAGALGRAPRLASAYWQRKTTGGGVAVAGWAALGRLVAPGKWPRWPSLSYFCSVLFFSISAICF